MDGAEHQIRKYEYRFAHDCRTDEDQKGRLRQLLLCLHFPAKGKGNHVRAEFYIPAYGWIPADPTFENGNPAGDYFGIFTGAYVIMSTGVNSSCKDANKALFKAGLLQSFFFWYWYTYAGDNLNFSHVFSSF